MTTYSVTKEWIKTLPYKFKCRVYGKYDTIFKGVAPNNITKEYADLPDYTGFNCNVIKMKSANVSRFGNPTIDDNGIISGFSNTAWAWCDDSSISFANSWEFVVKFTTPSSISANSNIIACKSDTKGIRVGWTYSDKLMYFYVGNGSWFDTSHAKGTTVLTGNTTYWYKFGWDGTNYYAKISTDGVIYTNDVSYASSSTPVYDTYPFRIGINGTSSSSTYYPMKGTIDLSECYLMVQRTPFFPDKELVWSGTTETIKLDFTQTELPWKWEYESSLIKSVYGLAAADTNVVSYGNTMNGVVTGTATNMVKTAPDRVMSAFSSSTYLQMLPKWNPTGTWKIHLRIKTPASFTGTEYITGQPTTNYTTPQLGLNASGQLFVYLSSNKTSWDIASGLTTTTTLNPSTFYNVDLYFTGTEYKIDIDGVNGLTIENSTHDYSGTYPIILGYDKGNTAFSGSVCLGESYITFGDEEVWRGFSKETFDGCVEGTFSVDTTLYRCYAVNGNEKIKLVKKAGSTINTDAENPRYLGEINVGGE